MAVTSPRDYSSGYSGKTEGAGFRGVDRRITPAFEPELTHAYSLHKTDVVTKEKSS
jgi:hypothetical protein